MASRDDILRNIRASLPPAAPIPEWTHASLTFSDRLAKFTELIEVAGGRCVRVANDDMIQRELAAMPVYAQAKRIVSRVPGIGSPTLDLDTVADPHELEDVDIAILPGEFGVAENGAIWLTDQNLKHRAIPFITQHLILIVSCDQIVNTMHDAYARLQFGSARFGVFISGPSKTADIEQSLVIGAHGPRSLTVFCR